ncbi:MAG: zinc-ribbon domain-containing protein, partial [Anaerolineales bacterium]
ELLQALQTGQLSEDAFLDQVSELTLRDAQGQWWMIGARTGKWYVSQGGNMVEATPPELAASQPEVAVPGGAPRSASSGRWPQCGAPLAPGARFCGTCGHEVPKPPIRPVCPHCGAEVKPDARFCGNCGGRLTVAEVAPAAPTIAVSVPPSPPQPPAAPQAQPTPAPIERPTEPPAAAPMPPAQPVAPAVAPLTTTPLEPLATPSVTRPLAQPPVYGPESLVPEAISPLEEPAPASAEIAVERAEPSPPPTIEPTAAPEALPPLPPVAAEEPVSVPTVTEAIVPEAEPVAESEPTLMSAPPAVSTPSPSAGEPAISEEIAASELPEVPAETVAPAQPTARLETAWPIEPESSQPTPTTAGGSEAAAPPLAEFAAEEAPFVLPMAPELPTQQLARPAQGVPPPPSPPPPPPPPDATHAAAGAAPSGRPTATSEKKRLPTWMLGVLGAIAALLVVGLGYWAVSRRFGLGGSEQASGEPTATVTLVPTLTRVVIVPLATATSTPTALPSVTAEPAMPSLQVSHEARFAQDTGAKAILDPGDIVRYRVSVRNAGQADATGVVLTTKLDDAVELVGDVQVGSGQVTRGKSGDREVIITLPKLEAGIEWWIEYYVQLRPDAVGQTTAVIAQTEVSCAELDTPVRSDDPDTVAANDPTVIEVVPATATATIEPATATPTMTVTPTATPTATHTVAPTTAQPSPTAAATAAPTAPPLSVTNVLTVSNGAYGTNNVWIEHKDGIFADTAAGRYQCELGFFTTAEAQAALQAAWTQANRSGANWRMRIVVRGSQSWISCGSNPTCYDNVVENTSQAELKVEVYMQPGVWNALANAYVSGGYGAMIANEYYDDMQGMIFAPMGASTPSTPVIAIKFTRVG